MKRFSYKFVREYADLLSQKLTRCQRLGDRASYYYIYYLNNVEYKNLKDVIKRLSEIRKERDKNGKVFN